MQAMSKGTAERGESMKPGAALWLRPPTVRKGFAFPLASLKLGGYASATRSGGIASIREAEDTESRRLSALGAAEPLGVAKASGALPLPVARVLSRFAFWSAR